MIRKIAISTGGGDAPGLNAVIRAVVRCARDHHRWEVVGIEDGFDGLIEARHVRKMKQRELTGSRFSIIVVAEGAKLENGAKMIVEKGSDGYAGDRLGGIGNWVAEEAVGKLKTVPADGQLVQAAEMLGISLGR